jgi:hypothetical protein
MLQYVHSVDTEISGYGRVQEVPNGLLVDKVVLLEQTVSKTDTDIQAHSVTQLGLELHKAGEDIGRYKLWWHSHNTMAVFWSGTDEKAMSPEQNNGRDYLVSVVVNFKHETKGRVDFYKPFHVKCDDIAVEVIGDGIPEISDAIKAEVAAKVKTRVVTHSVATHKYETKAERKAAKKAAKKGGTHKLVNGVWTPQPAAIDDEDEDIARAGWTTEDEDEFYDELAAEMQEHNGVLPFDEEAHEYYMNKYGYSPHTDANKLPVQVRDLLPTFTHRHSLND